MNTQQETIGVIIGRFQVDDLHAGHRHLIEEVMARHTHVCILIGARRAQCTARDPLDYEARKAMVAGRYPNACIHPIFDHPDNEAWCDQVDEILAREFPGRKAVLYGSRDSFLAVYDGYGQHTCETICEVPDCSATKIRNGIVAEPKDNADFRAGIIYGAGQRYPTSYQTVDVAVLHMTEPLVLLGQKAGLGEKWWFVGGFVDPTDETLELAAKREAVEEIGDVELDGFKYIGSTRMKDARYRNQPDQIMTAFYAARFIFGRIEPTDDLTVVKWQPLEALPTLLADEHQVLGTMLANYLAANNHTAEVTNHVIG